MGTCPPAVHELDELLEQAGRLWSPAILTTKRSMSRPLVLEGETFLEILGPDPDRPPPKRARWLSIACEWDTATAVCERREAPVGSKLPPITGTCEPRF
jgi:hypothetical protein